MEDNKKNRRPRKEREVKEFEEVVLQVARVTRVVKGGRRLRFRATVAIGDKKGKIGLGVGKAGEVADAIKKAVAQAKKDMVIVPMVNGTIPHPADGKVKAAKVVMMPAKEGKGIIAGGAMRPIMVLAGIRNVYGKRFGSNNPLANAQAVVKALRTLHLAEGQTADEVKVEKKDDKKPEGKKPAGKKHATKRELPAHTFGKKKEEAAPVVAEEAPAVEAPAVEAPATETTAE